jgi:hypothetical protein
MRLNRLRKHLEYEKPIVKKKIETVLKGEPIQDEVEEELNYHYQVNPIKF